MCGILGTINLNFSSETLDIIARRGPDDSGIVTNKAGEHNVSLGHRRLSILDLSSAGHQPMSDYSRQYTLCYNGEVYNHSDLRKTLSDVSFKGHSDTETILNYLIRNGIDCVDQLNGIFAFAFLDANKNKLYLVRDPFGIKPLYYRILSNKLIFCSEIKPILSLGKDELSIDNLSELLTLRYSASPNTLFRNIRKVRPGHIIEFDLNTSDIHHKEYTYIRKNEQKSGLSFNEAIEQYGHYFKSAVNRQLMSDVDLGVLLSGGIDSALVAKYATLNSAKKLKAFTVGFGREGYADETSDARESADIIGMDYMDVHIDFDDFLNTIKKCVSIVEEPSATTSIVPMYYLSRLAADNVKVVLSGQGADEPLGGYRRYQGELLHKWLPDRVVSLLKPIIKISGITNEALIRGIGSLSCSDDVLRFLNAGRVFEDTEITQLIGKHQNNSVQKIEYFYDLLNDLAKSDRVERLMSIDMHMNLSDDLLLYTDKITMHHSLECRVPMLDHELIRFIESLPLSYKMKLRQGKIIHKEFSKRVLPLKIVNREKKGFLSPTKEWFRKKEVLAELLLDNKSRFSTVFDVNAVENIINQHLRGFNRERHIFLLLSTYFWLEEYC